MKCPKCNAEVQADAKFCANCGTPLSGAEKPKRIINIYGYKEWYAIDIPMDVYMNNEKIGTLSPKGKMTVELGDDNYYFEFVWHNGYMYQPKARCNCYINKTFCGGIQLCTNRWLGTISVAYTMH